MRVLTAFVATPLLLVSLAGSRAEPAAPAGITTRNVGDGWIFGDARGMTLYVNDRDKQPGKSACIAECAREWLPALASADAKPVGDWSVIMRDDGVKQWAFGGKPLYTYVQDAAPGDVGGDGVGYFLTLAHVLFQPMATPPGITVHATAVGRALADARGMTLYNFDRDTPISAACNGACVEIWSPLMAPSIANAVGDWLPIARDDGTRQWAYKGRPLYTYARDANPGDTGGDGANPAWHAAIVRPAPGIPPGMTMQSADVGRVVADGRGLTIYTMTESPLRAKFCDDACLGANWRPVLATSDAHSLPGWSLVARGGGAKQWAYKGKLLFTFAQDAEPGDIRGDRFGNMASGGLAPFEPLQLPL